MTEKPFEYKGIKIDTNEEVGGDYLVKDPIFGWKIGTTNAEYRVHADSIKRLVGESDMFPGCYVYRGWTP